MQPQLKDILHHYMGQKVQIPGSVSWAILNAHNYAYFKDGCVLALRPLDSMTEEERNERAGLVRTIPGDKLWIVEGKATNPAGIFEFGARMDGVNAHWLLSRGFDLFGLIESGAAVDVKTIN